MRLITFCLLAMALSGCTAQSHKPQPVQAVTPTQHATPAKKMLTNTTRPGVAIYNSVEALNGKAFLALGGVSGDDCQVEANDFPPNLVNVRQQMQQRAAALSGNALLMQSCEVLSGSPGCYREATCQGSAIRVAE